MGAAAEQHLLASRINNMARLAFVACASVTTALALEPAAPAAPVQPVLPSATPDLKSDASQQLMNFLQAKPLDASNAMLEASPAKPFYYPYTAAAIGNTTTKAAMMATYHTDMMALMYVYSFFIAYQKIAVAAGGYEIPKKGAKGKESSSSMSLEKKTMQSLDMMQNPFAMFWQKQKSQKAISKTVEHDSKDLEKQPPKQSKVSKADKKAKSSQKNSLHPSFLEVELAPAAPLPALPSGKAGKADTQLKHLDDELLVAERTDTNTTKKLDTLTIMSIQSIYFDVLANFHIVMASLYSMPAAFAGLKTPTAKSYVTWSKVMAFYYWGGTQYFVDILDIQGLGCICSSFEAVRFLDVVLGSNSYPVRTKEAHQNQSCSLPQEHGFFQVVRACFHMQHLCFLG